MPADINAVIERALPLCKPTEEEVKKIMLVAEEAKKLVESEVACWSEVTNVVFGGSFAKGTWLKDDADIDIFFKVRRSVSNDVFETMGKTIGQQALKKYRPKLRYSDHPYVEAFIKGVRINVVPCYDVEQGEWQSAADRSPFHTQYITNRVNEEKRNQIRLLKKFFKSVGIYGAEIAIGGFSGYVSEVLVLKYGSFENVLQAIVDIKERQVIAIDDSYDSDIIKGFQSQVIIIDPVDRRRNLGAAISPENIAKFVLAARAFLNNPLINFFREEHKDLRIANKMYKNIVFVEFTHKERSPDIIWGQLKRILNSISKQLEIEGFIVLRGSCITDEKKRAVLAFLLESITLGPYIKKKGPEVFRRSDTTKFISKNKVSLIMWIDKEMRIVTLINRKNTNARQFIKSIIFKNIENSGIMQGLLSDKKELKIYSGNAQRIRGLAQEAAIEIVSTEHLIFQWA